jgi:hypothetical protein
LSEDNRRFASIYLHARVYLEVLFFSFLSWNWYVLSRQGGYLRPNRLIVVFELRLNREGKPGSPFCSLFGSFPVSCTAYGPEYLANATLDYLQLLFSFLSQRFGFSVLWNY